MYRFQGRYSTIERSFKSPFGLYGAIYALLIFALVYISSAFLQNDAYMSVIIIAIYTVIITIYYYIYPINIQIITDEEFRMNVINANYRRIHGDIIYRCLKYMNISDKYIFYVKKAIKSISRTGSRSASIHSNISNKSNTNKSNTNNSNTNNTMIQTYLKSAVESVSESTKDIAAYMNMTSGKGNMSMTSGKGNMSMSNKGIGSMSGNKGSISNKVFNKGVNNKPQTGNEKSKVKGNNKAYKGYVCPEIYSTAEDGDEGDGGAGEGLTGTYTGLTGAINTAAPVEVEHKTYDVGDATDGAPTPTPYPTPHNTEPAAATKETDGGCGDGGGDNNEVIFLV